MSSELHYSGSFTVSKSPNEVLNFITDLPRAITCIPNIINYEVLSKDRVKARFRVDLGNEVPIAELRRITTDATIELINQSGNEVRYRVDGRAAGSAISILLTIRISGSGNDSRIDWDATAGLGRLLQMMSRFVSIDSLVKRISEDTIHGFIECLLR
ncbi:MAG: SRPBCC domain-containing protein [Vulcanisaeta sp.]|jgi:carbon monoxide dehydrogenase subunit G|uniref:SRPBCC domain-containing protein n=1 Tax=Vulcanisaeta sp. TaxID=2020871 RepID=UPI003D0AF3D7